MKIGLIGCGGMGTTHNLSLKALSEIMDVEVTAVADCRQEFREKAASIWENAQMYQTGMELIENAGIDVVHICLPSFLHADHAVAAMEKGIHTLIEKPVCLTKEDGARLLEAERKTGVKVSVGHVIRFFDEYNYLKEVYDSNKFGKLKSLMLQRLSGDVVWGQQDWFHDEKKSGSVVLDLHIHDIDFLRYMLGDPDNFFVTSSSFDNGMVNQINTTYKYGDVYVATEGLWDISPTFNFEASYRASFEEATVIFNGNKKPTLTVYHRNGEITYPEIHSEYNVEDESAGINISNLGPYYSEIKYFLECVIKDEKVAIAPLSEGVKSMEQALKELEATKKDVL